MATKYKKTKQQTSESKKLIFTAVGDMFLPGSVRWVDEKKFFSDEAFGKTILDKVAPYFKKSDINFGNLESPISDKGQPQAGRYASFRSYTSMADVLKNAGIDFVSLANNHSLDYGWEAAVDTMERLKKNGIGYAGAGKNIVEARKPAIIRKGNLKIGMLSYTANVNTPYGFKASQNREGLAPIRISPFFLPDHCNQEDIDDLHQDINNCKKEVDFLVVSCHWGISEGGTHTVSLHQEVIAHHAIDAGADLVIGHHPHALQAVEIYKQKPICYSLGNFIFSMEEGFPRETMLFQCLLSRHKVHEVKFIPVYISDKGQPEVVSPDKGQGAKIVSLMEKLCAKYAVDLSVQRESGEVICKIAK